jgi:hypothetical protein
MLLGAEFNAEIEHALPYRKTAGERKSGEQQAIGALAALREAAGPESCRAE